jgi:uncharacterized protein (DUF1697 family)
MREWVVLLRAVNLGARNKVNMPHLRKALTAAGFDQVRTYLQSGNVLLHSTRPDPAAVATAVRDVVRTEFDLDTPVLVRTPEQLRSILSWCPFPEPATTRPTTVQVVHLDAEPHPTRLAATLAEDWHPDQLAIRGPEACICYASSMHASRLQHRTLLNRLGVTGTARNWRTLTAIAGLLTAD